MIGLEVKNNIITNKAVFSELPTGWVEAPLGVEIGWTDNEDGTYSPPVTDPLPLEEVRTLHKQHINTEREKAINSGVTYGGNSYDTDKTSRDNLTGIHTGVNDSYILPAGFTWRTSDNQNIPFTVVEVNGLAHTVLDHVNTQYGKSWVLKASIDAATTEDEVNAIVW